MSMRMVPVQGVFQKMSRLARDLSRKAGQAGRFRHRRRGDRAGPHRGRQDRRSSGPHGSQRHRPRHRAAGGPDQGRQESDRTRRTAGLSPGGQYRHRDGGRRQGSRQGPDSQEGRRAGAGRAGPGTLRGRGLQADFPSGSLDGREGHEHLRPRRRHGRGQEEHRSAARPGRYQLDAGQGHDLHDPPAADAGRHRRPGRPHRREPLHHPDQLHRAEPAPHAASRSPPCRAAARWSWNAAS